MNPDMAVALLTAIVALVAVIAVWQQSRDTHLALGVQLLRDLEKQFDGQGLRSCRATISSAYLMIKREDLLPSDVFANNSSVFDFFQTVGILVDRGILDPELTSASFLYWFRRYWELAALDVDAYRKTTNDLDSWADCDYLYGRIVEDSHWYHRSRVKKLDSAEIFRFLKEESQLTQISLAQ